MPARTEELTLIFRRERIRFDGSDCCILECETPPDANGNAASQPPKVNGNGSAVGLLEALAPSATAVTVKADAPEGELVQGLSYRFYGHWTNHDRYGRQFQARTFVRCQPHGRAGVIRYLQATCAGHGVGRATAERLWDRFQGDAVRILREQPDVAAAAVGMQHFSEEKATEAAAVLREESALEAVSIDLIDLLGGRGSPKDTAKKCVAEWGNKAAEIVKKSAYNLMRFRGCGWKLCDRLFTDNGGDPKALKRQAYAAWYTIARDTNGNTWFMPEQVEAGLRDQIGGTGLREVDALKLAKRARLLTVIRDATGRIWLAEYRKAQNEKTIAEWVAEALDENV